jgi:hypothetical protein
MGGVEGRGEEGERVDDLKRSEFNDHERQLPDERQLTNIVNHQPHPAPPLHDDSSLIGRLRSMLGTRDLDVDHRQKERRSISDPDRQLILNEK